MVYVKILNVLLPSLILVGGGGYHFGTLFYE